MDDIIGLIVNEAFEKVRQTSSSHKKSALSNNIEEQSDPRISYKTAERAHRKYIDEVDMDWSLSPSSLDNFCKFIGYVSYKDYVENNDLDQSRSQIVTGKNTQAGLTESKPKQKEIENQKKNKKEKIHFGTSGKTLIFLIVVSVLVFCIAYYSINHQMKKLHEPREQCMAWAQDHYIEIDCSLDYHPTFNTKVEELVEDRMMNMKRVELTAASTFFSEETGKPLVWYYKNKSGDFEYFTSPGRHPLSGETLKKITPTIIQKYVPTHQLDEDSFLKNE